MLSGLENYSLLSLEPCMREKRCDMKKPAEGGSCINE